MRNENVIYLGIGSPSQSISPHTYAQSCQLYQLFEEVTRIVGRKSNINVSQALSQYLNQCNKGEHVVLKSYSSFNRSILNRQCFLYNFCKIFEIQSNIRNGLDYFQLFRLLCSDFPKQIIVNAVKFIQGEHDHIMEILLNSDLFFHSLYLSFIYCDYLEQLLQKIFKGKYDGQANIIEVFDWIVNQNQQRTHSLQKPNIQILIQIIINIVLNKSQTIKSTGVKFVNSTTVKDYLLSVVGQSKNTITLSFSQFVNQLLENKKHQKYVQKTMSGFDNSGNWALEASKIISIRELENPQPLNSKKMKKK